jgi:hypothetical protein
MTNNIQTIDINFYNRVKALGLPEVKENSPYLVIHVKGDGIRTPATWNAKIYKNSSGTLKLVTADYTVLDSLLSNKPSIQAAPAINEKAARIISIDDSGWGFPLLGTLIGLHDSLDDSIHIGEVSVNYYQSPCFEKKAYLWAAANTVNRLVGELDTGNADCFRPQTVNVLFKVCTGYVNTGIVKDLQERGFKVETCKIGEPLQSALEAAHMEYVNKTIGSALYYDTKGMNSKDIGRKFNEVIAWMKKNNAWHLTKTGWKYFKNMQR